MAGYRISPCGGLRTRRVYVVADPSRPMCVKRENCLTGGDRPSFQPSSGAADRPSFSPLFASFDPRVPCFACRARIVATRNHAPLRNLLAQKRSLAGHCPQYDPNNLAKHEGGSAVDLMSSGVPLWSAGTARSLKITIVTTGSTMTVRGRLLPTSLPVSYAPCMQPVSYAPCMRDHMDLLVLCVIVATRQL